MKIECTVEELKELVKITSADATTDAKILLNGKSIFEENHD